MEGTTDEAIREALVALVTTLALAYAIYLLLGWLRRSRPGLSILTPIAVGFAVRVLIAVGLSAIGFGELRRGDETNFLLEAHSLANDGAIGGISWLEAFASRLHVVVFASQLVTLDSPELVLRITQCAIAIAGAALLAAAVYELAGARAAVIAAWVIALEPSNVFFSIVLHKEPNMMLAGGLVAVGGASLWKRATISSLIPMALGCGIAMATRPYVGWFLIAAAAAILLHAGFRHWQREAMRSMVMLAGIVLLGALTAPIVWQASSEESLREIDLRQERITSEGDASLDLEEVDYSTRSQVVLNLPQRVRDVLFRPYPWEIGNLSQRLGLIGNLIAWTALILLVRELVRNRGRIMDRAGPFVYVGFLLLIAYALSAGNAGTAFRYRTHVVALAIALIAVLWAARTRESPAPRSQRAHPITLPAPAGQSP